MQKNFLFSEMLSDEQLHTRIVKRLSRHDPAEGRSSADDVLCQLEVIEYEKLLLILCVEYCSKISVRCRE